MPAYPMKLHGSAQPDREDEVGALEAQRQARLAKLFELTAGYVLRSLALLGVHQSDLQDASQEVYLVAFRRLDAFDGQHPLAWMRSICLRVASDFRKRANRRGAREQRLDSSHDLVMPLDPERIAVARQAHLRVLEVLESMDEPKRVAFVLFEIEGMTLQEIATELDTPLSTIASRLRAARQLVQAFYSDANRSIGGGT